MGGCRDAGDCECSHHYRRHRLRGALARLGLGSVRVDRWSDSSLDLLSHHLVLLQPPCGLLSISSGQEKLQIQRCCEDAPR